MKKSYPDTEAGNLQRMQDEAEEARGVDKIQPVREPFFPALVKWFMGLSTIWKSVVCLVLTANGCILWVALPYYCPWIAPIFYAPLAFLVVNGALVWFILLIKTINDDMNS